MTPRQESDSRESSPARRPNARTSCDVCKRMKIKCEREGDSCLHCIERGSQCETTLVERKRRQVKRVDPGSIVEMENRIKRLEAVIVASGLNGPSGNESPSDTDDTPPIETSSVTDRLSTLLIDDEGSSRFLGGSSGFSLFSPQGLQWISERTGNTELKSFIKSVSKSQKARPYNKNDQSFAMPASEREPLPPKDVADRWVRCFFETFNTMLPLYNRDIFEQYYARQYTANPPTGAAWYASINIVMAMGGMISKVHSHDGRQLDAAFLPHFNGPGIQELEFSRYYRNASSCFIELAFEEPSLLSVQAICGLAFLQQMSLQPHTSNVLTSTASRMAYSIGLHRKVDEADLSETEMNQRRNVFWIIYIMDKALSLRFGHPSVLSDDDIAVDLPNDYEQFSVYPDGSRRYGIFKYQVQLAMLESRIYTELYTAKAHRRSALDRLRSVGQLDKDLQDWRMTVPVEIRPDELIRCSRDHFPPVFLMHFEFFNCISTIHRISIHHRGPWTNENLAETASTLRSPRLNPRVYSSQSICLAAARNSVKLLKYVDMAGDFGFGKFIWTQIYYPLSAFLLLFANIIHNPEDPSATADLQLMDLVISLLAPMIGESGPFTTTAAVKLFRELRNVAKRFVENKMLQQTKKTKREYNSDVPKDGEYQPVAVVTEPYATMPQTQAAAQTPFMPFIAQPLKANTQQYAPRLVDGFENAAHVPHDQPMVPVDDAGFPTLGFDAFMFSDNFEWDLADLWNKEYSPNALVE